jgi:O-antigen/teichoic acid export membrane protein
VMLAPFVYVSLGQQLVTCVCQGLNRINLLAMQQIAPYAILLPLTAIEIFIFRSYSLPIAVANYLVVFTAIVASGIMRAGVSFTGSSERIRDIRRENKTTGFPLYVGGLFGVASAQVIALWVTQYTDSTEYGYYALGLAISSPLGVLVSAVGSVIFRASAEQHSLSRGVLWAVFTFAGLLGCVYWAGTVIFLVPLFGAKYAPALPISHLLGVGALMIGCGDIFQRFLGAKGRGALLGTAAVCTGVVGVSSAAFLLRPYGVYGAAFSSILAGTTYLFAMVFLYLNRPRGLRNKVDSSVSIL